MPWMNETDKHHCWCSTRAHTHTAPHDEHHEFCPVHIAFFYRAGTSCMLCEGAEEMKLKEERQQREEAAKKKAQEELDAWFKDTSKARKKPKTKKPKAKAETKAAFDPNAWSEANVIVEAEAENEAVESY